MPGQQLALFSSHAIQYVE